MADQGLAARVTLRLKGMDIQRASWLFLMSSLLFVMLLPFSSYVAALSFIQEEWDLNNTQAGAIFSAYLAGYALSALLIIPMTDRFGSKYIFIGSANSFGNFAHVVSFSCRRSRYRDSITRPRRCGTGRRVYARSASDFGAICEQRSRYGYRHVRHCLLRGQQRVAGCYRRTDGGIRVARKDT